jgi:hypothetical protein
MDPKRRMREAKQKDSLPKDDFLTTMARQWHLQH